jgi:hypothetical protein
MLFSRLNAVIWRMKEKQNHAWARNSRDDGARNICTCIGLSVQASEERYTQKIESIGFQVHRADTLVAL